jgi:hypothetical protein
MDLQEFSDFLNCGEGVSVRDSAGSSPKSRFFVKKPTKSGD